MALAEFISDYDLHLLVEGKHYRAYEKLGAHLCRVDGQDRRALRGPGAKRGARGGDR